MTNIPNGVIMSYIFWWNPFLVYYVMLCQHSHRVLKMRSCGPWLALAGGSCLWLGAHQNSPSPLGCVLLIQNWPQEKLAKIIDKFYECSIAYMHFGRPGNDSPKGGIYWFFLVFSSAAVDLHLNNFSKMQLPTISSYQAVRNFHINFTNYLS
jgi:hypothetical protein